MSHPILATASCSADEFRAICMQTIFDCCKWDPQIGDHPAMADFSLLLNPGDWQNISLCAEALSVETIAAEHELLTRPDLHRHLGLPRRVLNALRCEGAPSPSLARIMRFDFHYTDCGWRISEVNSDVPGGLIEASGFSALMTGRLSGTATMAGDPVELYVAALAGNLRAGGRLALVHATSYTDDRQMMQFLARKLAKQRIDSLFVSPEHIQWRDGLAFVPSYKAGEPVDGLIRFFPAEWIGQLPEKLGTHNYFRAARTPQSNPGAAILTQSKRFPLVWDGLATPLVYWRKLLPQTCAAKWGLLRQGYIFKPALGRVGEGICLPGVTAAREIASIRRSIFLRPGDWIAQRQFKVLPVETPQGMMYPCLGVYTVDGRAAGIYGRIGRVALTDFDALDVAVAIHSPTGAGVPQSEACVRYA